MLSQLYTKAREHHLKQGAVAPPLMAMHVTDVHVPFVVLEWNQLSCNSEISDAEKVQMVAS